ncbi:MAG: GTPase Era [Pseudomonadota bacterium]
MSADPDKRCGYAAIVGKPNVGKSTLLNRILGQPLSITAAKPQTTRHQILGVNTVDEGQIIFIDTPGMHADQKRAINRYMNRVARAVLADVDVVLWLIDAGAGLSKDDERVGEALRSSGRPVILVLNKIDRLTRKAALLDLAGKLTEAYKPDAVLMVSALKGDGVEDVEREVMRRLPFSRPFFDEDEITDRSERFLAAEFIREQVTRLTHQEVPYESTVEIESFERDGDLIRIGAVIWVERDGQKAILIGKQGAGLKRIGTRARTRLEELFGQKIFLRTWVKVKAGWSDDERSLRAFGYGD